MNQTPIRRFDVVVQGIQLAHAPTAGWAQITASTVDDGMTTVRFKTLDNADYYVGQILNVTVEVAP